MRNLLVCLREYSPVFLQALARSWDLEEPASSKNELAEQLASAMLTPGTAHPVLETLPPEAREALACVVASGGAMRGYLLTRRYGKIRPLGPNPLLRLRPWTNPDNPLEALYYRGLLYRTYDVLGDYRGEVLFLPPQLVAALPPMEYTKPAFSVLPTSSPISQQFDGNALAMDAFAILAYLRKKAVGSGKGPFLKPRDVAALQPRLQAETDQGCLPLLQRAMRRAKLVIDERSLVRPGPQAQAWLRSDSYGRSQTLFEAWRSDRSGHELHSISGLRWDSTGRPHDASVPRKAILSHLAQCPADSWISLSSFVAAVKDTNPDFLRPDGDYDSWYIRDTEAKRFLTGFESWDQVEGRFIAHIITSPLRWLGAVAIGQGDAAAPQIAFRLSPMGLAFLGLGSPEPDPKETRPFVLAHDFLVCVPPNASLYDCYQLERFSEWQGGDEGTLLYRLTRESVWQGQAQGIETHQMIAFLSRVTAKTLPDELTKALAEWGDHFGKVTLRRAVLLQTPDEATLERLQKNPALAGLLGEQVSPRTTLLLDEGNLDQVARQLRQMGYWPQVEPEQRRKGDAKRAPGRSKH